MTISSQVRTAGPFAGNGVSVFPFTFKVFQASDLLVVRTDPSNVQSTLVLGSTFTAALNADQNAAPGGSITLSNALATGYTLTISSHVPLTQPLNLTNAGGFFPKNIEDALDRVVIMIQELSSGQALRLPELGISGLLPPTAVRANTVLAFDTLGRPTTTVPIAGSAAAVMAAYAVAGGAALIGALLADGVTASTVAGALAEMRATLTTTTVSVNDNDALQQVAADLGSGAGVAVDVFGDSTQWGADPANLAAQVAIPPPQQLQNFVNTFLGSSLLTVTNRALPGTTLAQMLAGTDGSGSTFVAKMATSGARVVYLNHGVNDAFGGYATSATTYRAGLIAFVKAVRAVSKTPVFITPHPCLTIGTFGSQARSEATGRFAQVMREVAQQHAVFVVDNYALFTLTLGIDGTQPLALFPDGVHATAAVYAAAGNNMADALLGGQVVSFRRAGQRITASGPAVRATTETTSVSNTSRYGAVTTSGTANPQSLRVIFRVEEPGLDIYLAHPIYSNGSDAIAISLDGAGVGGPSTFSIYGGAFGSSFWQDFETLMVRNCAPGFHILIFTTSSTGAAGIHALRSRLAEKPTILPSANVQPAQRRLLSKKLELISATANTLALFDDCPASRFIEPLELEWTGAMLINSGLCIGGNVGSNSGTAAAQQALIFGLSNSGYASVWESNGVGTFAQTIIGATNLAGASHLFRVAITSARFGVVSFYVDDALVGTVTLTQPYYGGLIGLWKNIAGGVLAVTDISRIWRS